MDSEEMKESSEVRLPPVPLQEPVFELTEQDDSLVLQASLSVLSHKI